METTRGRGIYALRDTGNDESPPVVPPWEQQLLLVLHAVALMDGAQKALESGDDATGARMTAEAEAAFKSAWQIEQRARNQ
jgi:hypothetical protein